MSSHTCDVVRVKLEKHPNADRLSLVKVFGWTCAVRTEDWKDGDHAAFIPPDSLVDTRRSEFAFLANWPGKSRADGWARITAQKLRGVVSYGLLVPTKLELGMDAAGDLGVIHYEPPEYGSGGKSRPYRAGDTERGQPDQFVPVYDVENIQRLDEPITGEVLVTEKIHGANARFLWDGKRFWVGSRKQWKRRNRKLSLWQRIKSWFGAPLPPPDSDWWRVFEKYPGIGRLLKHFPGDTLFGEVYGTQHLRYGLAPGQVDFVVFDLLSGRDGWTPEHGKWAPQELTLGLCDDYKIPFVPFVAKKPIEDLDLLALAQGKSLLGGDHLREGIVVQAVGRRAIAKVVNPEYLIKGE